jgi:hypothetical protein
VCRKMHLEGKGVAICMEAVHRLPLWFVVQELVSGGQLSKQGKQIYATNPGT